jgi:hypothetical protein
MLARAAGLLFARWQHLVAVSLLGLLSTSLILEARGPGQVYVDESEWITAGYVAFKLLRECAPLERWEHAFDERALGDWGNKNPPLGKYIIGFAVTPHIYADADAHYHWAPLKGADGKVAPRNLPPMAVLTAARSAVAACAGLALLGSYLVAFELTGSALWGALSALFLFFIPSFQFHAVRVYTDAPQIALLLFGSHALLRFTQGGRFRWLVFGLLCGGLACAVKFSSGAWWLAAVVYLGFSARNRSGGLVRRCAPLLAAGVVPLAGFIAVNPYLYRDPLTRSGALVQAWQASKALQRRNPQLAASAVNSDLQRFALVTARGALAPTSAPFMQSAALDAAARLTPSLLGLCAFGLLALWVAGFRLSLCADPRSLWRQCAWFMLGAAGEFVLTGNVTWFGGACAVGSRSLARQAWPAGPDAPRARAFACVLGSTWLVTALWLPFDWSRYYLPLVSQMAGVYALGTATLARAFAWTRRAGGYPIDSLPGGVAVGLAALVAAALGWALFSVVTPPLLPN